MSLRRVLLSMHLYVGVAAALFLIVLGVTGSILAVQPELERWLQPSLWRVHARGTRLSEQSLARLARAGVGRDSASAFAEIRFAGPDAAQVFVFADGVRVFVDPYSGEIRGTRQGATTLERALLEVRKLHVYLSADMKGQWTVDIATVSLLLLTLTGIALWWKAKIARLDWAGSWRRINFDAHRVIGIYAATFLMLLAVSGCFIAFEPLLQFVTRSHPAVVPPLPHSTVTTERAAVVRPTIDQLLAAADRALPGETTNQFVFSGSPRSSVRVVKSGSRGYGRSTVYLDQYSGVVLRADDFDSAARAERAHAINLALHTGTIAGLPGQLIMAVSSAGLVLLAISGIVHWSRKLARQPRRKSEPALGGAFGVGRARQTSA